MVVPGLFEECFRLSEHQQLIKLKHLSFQDGYYVTEHDLVIMVRGERPYCLEQDGWRRADQLMELWYDSTTDLADIPPAIVERLGLADHGFVQVKSDK